ncbi:DUF6528 family protein [Streptomyces sp. RPT161]|uniref:DUF6528 family protein n=1 Tax=Streptomyces sp. RPT161 TaxID=3015993 RepID=UPI0022B87603|nr:DUF6528 family protein [Streptomyces sp. RPT161]
MSAPVARSRRAVLGMMAAALTTGAAPASALTVRPRARTEARARTRSLLLAADQASERVLVLDPTDESWAEHGTRAALRSAARAALWSWSPTDDGSLNFLNPQRSWRNVSEAKHRVVDGRQWLLTCASAGLVAVVSYPHGRVAWATVVGGNAHSLELLPGGNVAVAASTGGFVRIYTASQGPGSARYVQYGLPGAHGVQWDEANSTLWALGESQLVGLKVDGSDAEPEVSTGVTVNLPDTGGHDLSAVARDRNRLWVTSTHHVRQYSISDDAFVGYPGQAGIDRAGVKSVGDDPVTGQVLTVTPQSGNPCQWCTSTIDFHAPDGRQDTAGASLYKARWLLPYDSDDE